MKIEEKIQQEIRRHAFDRVDLQKQEAAGQQYTRYTIDALKEVTGLPRMELESIANEVRAYFGTCEEKFFSIKNQIILAGSVLMPLCVLAWLTMMLV
jgi:adenylosuccinate lyase